MCMYYDVPHKKKCQKHSLFTWKRLFCFVLFAVVSSAVNMCNQVDFRKKIYSAVQAEIVNHHLAEYFWHPQNLKACDRHIHILISYLLFSLVDVIL